MPAPDPDALELRAIAPLIASATGELVGPVLLVTNGTKTIGITSSQLLRAFDGKRLAIATKLDGSSTVAVASWSLGRSSGVGLVELAGPVGTGDVTALPVGAVCATVDTRGAPSAIVTILDDDGTLVRQLVPVHVDSIETLGSMSDDVFAHLASPIEVDDLDRLIDGAVLFTWFPSDPVLGRAKEVLAVAMTCPYRSVTFKPRDLPPIAELIGLDDLGRALLSVAAVPDRPELRQVTGVIDDPKGTV